MCPYDQICLKTGDNQNGSLSAADQSLVTYKYCGRVEQVKWSYLLRTCFVLATLGDWVAMLRLHHGGVGTINTGLNNKF